MQPHLRQATIQLKKHFFGVPYPKVEALTTFDDAKKIISNINEYAKNMKKAMYSATNIPCENVHLTTNSKVGSNVMTINFLPGGNPLIKKDGTVKGELARGVDKNLDAEALRVVSKIKPFTPGKQRGKPVEVSYMLPVTFTQSQGR